MSANDADDLELVKLLEEMDNFGRPLVETAGGYPPYGGLLDKNGKITLVVSQSSLTGEVNAQSGEVLLENVRRDARDASIRVAAVANMAYIALPPSGAKTTAMVISLHHRTGRCVDYVIPFSKAASGATRFGEAIAGIGKTKLF